MRIDTTCPHCSKPAKSAWSKVFEGPLRKTHCENCGKGIQLDIKFFHFVLMLVWFLPVVLLPSPGLRFAAVILVGFGMSLFRAWRYTYQPSNEPITY